MQFSPMDQINGMNSIQADNKYQKRWRCTFRNAVSQIPTASFKESVTSKSFIVRSPANQCLSWKTETIHTKDTNME